MLEVHAQRKGAWSRRVHSRHLLDRAALLQYIAVGLLDSTIKVFHEDTLKFHLSLYGHRLPVLCLDVSSDSSLLVSGSADKNVKIWGAHLLLRWRGARVDHLMATANRSGLR